MRSLGNTVRGPPLGLMREAVHAYVVSVALHRAEAWYLGEMDSKGRPTKTKGLAEKIERAIANACRTAVPAYSTFLNYALL